MLNQIPGESDFILPILSEFRKKVSDLYGQRLRKVILYGSYARGKATQNSDIDLMIVLSDMESAFAEIARLNDLKFSIGLDYEVYISTNPVSEDFFTRSNLPIIKNVLREGIEI
ncbi:MAG: nucleotidyltransferase domain-containing protein [Lentimicrobium sp.]